jgi:hypothetical protein
MKTYYGNLICSLGKITYTLYIIQHVFHDIAQLLYDYDGSVHSRLEKAGLNSVRGKVRGKSIKSDIFRNKIGIRKSQ